jgi:DNA-directed RNA polymerase specialized sigma24 family protein
MEAIARSVARRYGRQCWWADRDDLMQEACLAVLAASAFFDPRVGVPRSAYLRRAARLAVGKFLWRESSPVHAPYGAAAGLFRAEVTEALADDGGTPDEEAHRERWFARVQARLHELASGDPAVALGLEVILLEIPLSEYARRSGLTWREVFNCRRAAWRAAASDPELFSLWADRP